MNAPPAVRHIHSHRLLWWELLFAACGQQIVEPSLNSRELIFFLFGLVVFLLPKNSLLFSEARYSKSYIKIETYILVNCSVCVCKEVHCILKKVQRVLNNLFNVYYFFFRRIQQNVHRIKNVRCIQQKCSSYIIKKFSTYKKVDHVLNNYSTCIKKIGCIQENCSSYIKTKFSVYM